QPPVGGALGGVAEARLAGPCVRQRPAQNPPRLSARPRAVVGDALVRIAAQHPAARGVERRRLAHRAVLAQAELDVPRRVAERGPLRGPRAGAWIIAVTRGEPEHPVPEPARPVAGGRGRPGTRGRVGEVWKAGGHARRGARDAAAHAGERVGPGANHCARILPLLRCGTTEAAMPMMNGFHALRELPEEKVTDTISRRILVGEKEMIVWWSMKAGAHAAAHRHPHEQMFWMISGRMDCSIGV